MEDTVVIIWSGDAIRSIVGPFDSDDDARDWARANVPDRQVWSLHGLSEPWETNQRKHLA